VYFREFQVALSTYLHANQPFAVYPETKGVPLEEMDTLFGEGEISGNSKDNGSLNVPYTL
jgi:hypothetical protein